MAFLRDPRGQADVRRIALVTLQGCVTRISAGRQVLLVDVDRYQGKRAAIIVVAGGASGDRVWVVGQAAHARTVT